MEATTVGTQRNDERMLQRTLRKRVDAKLKRYVGMVVTDNLLSLLTEESVFELLALSQERESKVIQ